MAAEFTEAASTAEVAALHEVTLHFEATGVKTYFGAGTSRYYGSNGAGLRSAPVNRRARHFLMGSTTS